MRTVSNTVLAAFLLATMPAPLMAGDDKPTVDPAAAAAKLFEHEALVRKALLDYPAALNECLTFDRILPPAERHAEACALLDAAYKQPAGTLARDLPPCAAGILSRKEPDALASACASLAVQKYEDAEVAAGAAERAIPAGAGDATARKLAALEAAGLGACGQNIFSRAWQRFEEAAALADPQRDLTEWRRVHRAGAAVLANMDRAKEVEPILRKVLKQYETARGAASRETVNCREDLAQLLVSLSRPDEAEAEWRAVVTAREQAEGQENPRTLRAVHALVLVLHKGGKLAEAESLQRKEYAIHLRLQGPEHRETLQCRNNITACMKERGLMEEAEKEYRALLADCLRILGADDNLTLDVRSNLALLHMETGRKEEGLAEYRAVAGAHERTRGADHPLTIRARGGLIQCLEGLDRAAEAEPEYRKQIASLERAKGAGHVDTLTEKYKLGNILYRQHRSGDAETLLATVVEAGGRSGEEGKVAAKACASLAVSLAARGDAAAAKGDAKLAAELRDQALRKAMAGRELAAKVFPEDSPTVQTLDLLIGAIGGKLKDAKEK